jgi:hypothetical protein
MSDTDRSEYFPPAGASQNRGLRASVSPVASEAATARRAVCQACDQFNGALCEAQFPTGCCLTTWAQFLATGTCPLGKWA